MAAFLAVLASIWSFIWTILSPVKGYIITAILAIVIWQMSGAADWLHPHATSWDAQATVVSVQSGTALTVNHVSSDLLNRKRNVVVTGVLTDASTLNKLLPGGTEITIHVTDGNKLGAGQLTGVVDISGGK